MSEMILLSLPSYSINKKGVLRVPTKESKLVFTGDMAPRRAPNHRPSHRNYGKKANINACLGRCSQALMAEWLRRVIRNHLGSSRAGSNPVQCALLFSYF